MADDKEAPAAPGEQGDPKPDAGKGMRKVDEAAQEQAAEEREKSGGYD